MIVVLGLMFILSTQPMMVISMLIFITLMYSMYLFWILSSFWFSYMMILILMSGIIVVFTYMMSILPNESFEISSMVMVIMGVVMFYKFSSDLEFMQNVSCGSMKIWGGVMMVMSMFLVIYLLVVMVMVVWVSMLEKGAIRISM